MPTTVGESCGRGTLPDPSQTEEIALNTLTWIGYGMSILFTILAAIRTKQLVFEGKKEMAGSAVLCALFAIGYMPIGTAGIIVTAIYNS